MSFVDLPGPSGRLEAFFWEVDDPKAAVVVCHPHPQHGGTMHNHITYRVAETFKDAGVSALRFNFRGVGRSEGSFDEGRGEVDDAAAAINYIEKVHPGVPLLVAGFSFGSTVAWELAWRDERVRKLLAVGVPVDVVEFSVPEELAKPKAIVQGDRDVVGAVQSAEALLSRLTEPKRLFVVPDCDHLAFERLDAFSQVAQEAVKWLLSC